MFSVIIPTFGRPQFLRQAIASVLAQTNGSFEVIVVDDASPQPVAASDDPRVRVVRAAVNGGASAARNLGVEHATGEALAFLDDDDTWVPERLALAESGLDRAPVALCWQSPAGGRRLDGAVHDRILDSTTPSLGATVVAREAWLPLDTTYRAAEDLVWWLDVTNQAEVSTTTAQGLVVRRHDGDRTGYGARERIEGSRRLLDQRSDYFQTHPRAMAFRWKRIGLMHLGLGEMLQARRSFLKALRAKPSVADVAHLVRSLH